MQLEHHEQLGTCNTDPCALEREIATEDTFVGSAPLFYHRTRRPTNAPPVGQQIVILAPTPP